MIANVPPIDIEVIDISHIILLPSIPTSSYATKEFIVTCRLNANKPF
jgi:hypothetical protein